MAEAVRVFGRRVVAPDQETWPWTPRWRQLLRLVFGTHDSGQQIPEALADLIADPGTTSKPWPD